MENLIKELLIIYHYPCYDGALGAINTYIYYKNFSSSKYNITLLPLKNVEFKFINLNNTYNKIIIIDLDLKDEDIKFLIDTKNDDISIILFDHHESWIDRYNNNYKEKIKNRKKTKIFFDQQNNKSGCGLTFNYYKNKALNKQNKDINKINEIFSDNLYQLNLYIEDSDTGKNILNRTEEFKSGLCHELHPLNIISDFSTNHINKMNKFLGLDIKFTIRNGEKYLKKIKKNTKNEILHNKVYLFQFKEENQKCLGLITQNQQLRNFTGPLLGKISKQLGFLPIGILVYHNLNNLYKVSFRVSENDSYDVTKIVLDYGGGGHQNAASFEMDFDNIKKLIVKEVDVSNIVNTINF